MRRSGFTLTELAVVIAMICIIIGIGGCIKKVSNKGLKNVVSDIWNGEGGQE
jgi:prepilin-type N-terminal cleavage/methylation domain-containing protein